MTTAAPGRPAPARAPSRIVIYTALLLAVGIAGAIARLPEAAKFMNFAFDESGSNLAVHDLWARGLRPVVDVGYPYGSLTLLLGRLWFGAFGLSPTVLLAGWCLCGALMAWGIARVAAALRLRPDGVALLLAAAPAMIRVYTPNLAQGIEAALLTHALAEQVRGRYGRALSLATAACFAKPSMAYVYGLVLVLAVAWKYRHRLTDRALWLGVVLPPAVTGLTLAAALSATLGPEVVVRTLLPLSSAEAYRHFGYGILGVGRNFWQPPGATLKYYLGTEAGIWLAASIALAAAAAWVLWRLAVRRRGGKVVEMIVTFALIHAAFVTLMFGNMWSWFYYFYALVLGVAAAAHLGRGWSALTWVLAAVALLGNFTDARAWARAWRTTAPRAELAGLWGPDDLAREWVEVRDLTRGTTPVGLNRAGDPHLLFPDFAPPAGAYFDHGYPRPAEVRRQLDRIEVAETVVVPVEPNAPNFVTVWPEFQAALGPFELIREGRYFRVYARRDRPHGSAPGGKDPDVPPRPGASKGAG
jgi:hypothetical protein